MINKNNNSITKKNNEESKKVKNKNSYDYDSKRLLSRKDMMSYILKYLVPEYKDIDIVDIKNSLETLEDNMHIKTLNSEDDYIHKQAIYFDILFIAKVPYTNEEIALYIDLEPQGTINNKYELIKRAIYYASRLVSRQKGDEFIGQDYNNIKKVYSIWLDTNGSKDRLGSINSYTLNEKQLCGNYIEPKQNYDLINIIIAYISDKDYGEYQYIMKLLYMMFIDNQIEGDDKVSIIKHEYDNIELDKEFQNMCNYGEVRELKAKEAGLNEGIELGALNMAVDIISNYMNSFNVSLNQAITSLKIKDDIKDKVIEEVKKKLN